MTRSVDIDGLDQRARRAGYGDGLLELFAAAMLLTIAMAWLVNPAFVGILAAFIVLYGWRAVERVKTRVTYPRVGYHKERADDSRSTARGMLLFLGGAFLFLVLVVLATGRLTDAAEWRRAAPIMSGISLAGGFWYAGAKSGLVRYRAIAGLSVVSGVLLWWVGSGESYALVVWHLVSLAVPLALLGVWSLVRFLRTRPVREVPPDPAPHE